MGILWSMDQEPCHQRRIRFQKRDVTTPVVVNIKVFKGHTTWDNLFDPHLKPLAESQIYRRYMAKSVRREKVRHGNIRGVLFTPPGKSVIVKTKTRQILLKNVTSNQYIDI